MGRWILAAVLVGCAGGGGDTDPATPAGPTCDDGCVATLAADCPNGPADQATCVSDCEALRAGGCGTEYEAVFTCSDGEAVTCDGDGRPTVDACSAELAAFVSCINAG